MDNNTQNTICGMLAVVIDSLGKPLPKLRAHNVPKKATGPKNKNALNSPQPR